MQRSPGRLHIIPNEVISKVVNVVAIVFGFPFVGAVKDATKPHTLPETGLVTKQPAALTDAAAEMYVAGGGPTGHGSAT